MEQSFDLNPAMEQAGISMAELARRLGVSAPLVHYWASGQKVPSVRRLPAIAAALDCGIEDLFCTHHTAGRRAAPCR